MNIIPKAPIELRTKYDNNLQVITKILEESQFQLEKQNWSMHKNSYLQQTRDSSGQYLDVVKDYGCGHQSIKTQVHEGWCVPECEYYKSCLHSDIYLISQAEISSNGYLLNMLAWNYSVPDENDIQTKAVPKYSHDGDQLRVHD